MGQPSAIFREQAAAIVGAANCLFATHELTRYTAVTAPRPTPLAGAIRPASTDEVVGIVKLAARENVALYPLSTGRNWGYGDATPAGRDQVILDLGRMNRIIEVDERLAYAVIEPGVTQGQLHDFLKERGLRLWLDSTGAGPDAGIIGNILERGFGHTPYGDRFQTVSGIEVVLGTGEVLHTGFARFPQSPVAPLYPYGLGPVLDGLFSQSPLGIVTRMGVWLMPEPEYFAAAVAMADDPAVIGPLIERLRPLRMAGVLRSVVHIGNDYRLLSGNMRYPYERTGGATPISPDLRATLRREMDIPAWALSAGFYGPKTEVKGQLRAFRRALAGLGLRVMVVDDRKLDMGRRAGRLLGPLGRGLRSRIEDGTAAIGLLKGIPTRHFLKGAYWRSRRPAGDPPDPARDGVGIMWLGPVLPATAEHVERFVTLVERIFAAHGFECMLTFSMVTARALAAVLSINFDREDEAQAAAAEACYLELVRETTAAGYPPYRGHSGYMAAVASAGLDRGGEDSYWQVLSRIRSALDPHNLLSPGRYMPVGEADPDPDR